MKVWGGFEWFLKGLGVVRKVLESIQGVGMVLEWFFKIGDRFGGLGRGVGGGANKLRPALDMGQAAFRTICQVFAFLSDLRLCFPFWKDSFHGEIRAPREIRAHRETRASRETHAPKKIRAPMGTLVSIKLKLLLYLTKKRWKTRST